MCKTIQLDTFTAALRRMQDMVRFMSLMPLDIPNREVTWSIEMKGRQGTWQVLLAGKAVAKNLDRYRWLRRISALAVLRVRRLAVSILASTIPLSVCVAIRS